MLGNTAHYDPAQKSITLFITNRHPKDILRSFCHELVHHCQNERGDLSFEKLKTMNKNYAQENEHMRKMEEEAYLQGNMCFRDWEDGLDNKLQYTMQIAEQKFLKESKKMSVKITKKFLKETIEKLLSERVKRDSNDRVGGRISTTRDRRVKPLEEDDSQTKEEIKKQIEKLEKEIKAHKSAKLGSQYSKEQKAGHASSEKSKIKQVERLKKKLAGQMGDASADVKKAAAVAGKAYDDASAATSTDKLKKSLSGNTEKASVEEGSCGGKKKKQLEEEKCPKCEDKSCPDCKKKLKESEEFQNETKEEELEEASQSQEEFAANQRPFGIATAKDKAGPAEDSPNNKKSKDKKKGKEKKPTDESKIQTPEQENSLYEQRFTKKNTRLYEKLLKEWTK